MYRHLLMISTLALGLGLTAPAALADRDRHHDRDRDERRGAHWGQRHHDSRHHSRHDSRHDRHRDDHRRRAEVNHRHRHAPPPWSRVRDHHWRGPRYDVPRYHAPRGYVRHRWAPGHRVPPGYRHARYVVHDYRAYRLHPPPRGHHWLRVDNDVLLTAGSSGVVAAVVHGLFR